LDCAAALERIKEDKPITIKDDKGNTSKCIADIVSVRKHIYFDNNLLIDNNLVVHHDHGQVAAGDQSHG